VVAFINQKISHSSLILINYKHLKCLTHIRQWWIKPDSHLLALLCVSGVRMRSNNCFKNDAIKNERYDEHKKFAFFYQRKIFLIANLIYLESL